MGLEQFGTVTESSRGDSAKSADDELNPLAEKVDMDIPTLQEKPDKLDLISELRRRNMTFEKAKQKVLNMKDESDIDLSALEQSDGENEDFEWAEFYE